MNTYVIAILVALLEPMETAELTNHTNIKCADTLNCSMSNEVTMICDTLLLTSVPDCAENLERLAIRSGIIQRLYSFDFPPGLTSLKTLVVKNVFLKQIHKTTFENLLNLVELDLSENFLRSIDPDWLINNVYLERLNFSSNRIKKLVAYQFPLPNLKTLDLSNNNIEAVDETAFSNTTALQWLNLRTNKLKTFTFQVNATAILLSNNPWNCDCFVYWSISQYATDENIESSTCMDAERNQLRIWNDTNLSDSICEEEIRQSTNKSKRERNSREDNAPDLIITIYGYVFVALSALICMCCCCDKPRTRRISTCT